MQLKARVLGVPFSHESACIWPSLWTCVILHGDREGPVHLPLISAGLWRLARLQCKPLNPDEAARLLAKVRTGIRPRARGSSPAPVHEAGKRKSGRDNWTLCLGGSRVVVCGSAVSLQSVGRMQRSWSVRSVLGSDGGWQGVGQCTLGVYQGRGQEWEKGMTNTISNVVATVVLMWLITGFSMALNLRANICDLVNDPYRTQL